MHWSQPRNPCWGDGKPHREAPQSTASSLDWELGEAAAPLWHHTQRKGESSGVLGQPGLGSTQGSGILQTGGGKGNRGHWWQSSVQHVPEGDDFYVPQIPLLYNELDELNQSLTDFVSWSPRIP